jgi:hypothetical protein
MAGGMKNLSAMQSNFINAFYTDSQKANITTQMVSGLFESLGMSIPSTKAALVELIGTLDLTTDAGKKAYVAITGSTASLKEYFDGQAKAQDSFIQTQAKAQDSFIQAQEKDISDKKAQLSASIDAQKEILKASYDARVSALNTERDAINKTVTAINSLKSSLSNTYKSITQTISNPMASYRDGQAQLFDALSHAKAGTLPQAENIQDALTAVSQNTADYYSSFEDYARDQATTSGVITELMALSDNQLTTQNDQLTSIDQQLNQMKVQYDFDVQALSQQLTALNTINSSIVSIGDKTTSSSGGSSSAVSSGGSLMGESVSGYVKGYGVTDIMVGQGFKDLINQAGTGYNAATGSSMTAQQFDALINPDTYQYRDWSSYVPAYDIGTNYVPKDMIAQIHEGEMIVPKAFNPVAAGNAFVKNDADSALTKELLDEIKALRAENIQLQIQLLTESRKQTRLAEKADIDGIKVAA